MVRTFVALFLLPLAACDAQAPPPAEGRQKSFPAPAPSASAPAEAHVPEPDAGDGAADVLKRYYAHIEAGDYDAAWRLRSGGSEGDRERFAANFGAYERYRATVGTPSQPVAADGWLFVEVPVMIYGSFKGGKAFGSAGNVSMRRADTAGGATPAQRRWHVYTGD